MEGLFRLAPVPQRLAAKRSIAREGGAYLLARAIEQFLKDFGVGTVYRLGTYVTTEPRLVRKSKVKSP